MQEIVRGTTVKFKANFYDDNNLPFTPSGAAVYVTYKKRNSLQTVTITMPVSLGAGVAIWDSSVAEPGEVYWDARSTDVGNPRPVAEGSFLLVANAANPNS